MTATKKHVILIAFFIVTTFCVVELAGANGGVRETEYSTSLSEATGLVRIIVAAFGGLIGLLGILLAFKGATAKAEVSVSVSEHHKIVFKRVSQGVVITIIGAAILIAAVYLLPEKRSEREITGKEIEIEREGERETMRTLD
jgi:hypothetical protein